MLFFLNTTCLAGQCEGYKDGVQNSWVTVSEVGEIVGQCYYVITNTNKKLSVSLDGYNLAQISVVLGIPLYVNCEAGKCDQNWANYALKFE